MREKSWDQKDATKVDRILAVFGKATYITKLTLGKEG